MAHFAPERRMLGRQVEHRLNFIWGAVYQMRQPIEGWETVKAGEKLDVTKPPEDGWEPYTPGTPWGGADVTQWFRTKITIPEEMNGRSVVAMLDTGAESLCFLNGATTMGLDNNHRDVLLSECAAGESFDVLIDAHAYNNGGNFATATLAVRDEQLWSFYWDIRLAMDVVNVHPNTSQVHMQLLDLIHNAVSSVDINLVETVRTPEAYAEFTAQVKAAQDVLRKELKKFPAACGDGKFTYVGQSHLDTAWLWPLRITRKKCARTFSTVLKYMEQYPEYTFIMSQPQLFEYVKDHYPDVYEGVKQRVKEGRWELNGAAWVEQDLNVPSGEAHVRQYVYGNRFFRKEFGVHTRAVWLPDVFGYTFSLPQIMKKAQIDFFSTSKLGGNEYNLHPYNTFRWKGLDGTEVMAFLITTACNGLAETHRVKKAWDDFRQKDLVEELYYTYGHGDGGGGPTEEHIERGRRMENIIGVPQCTFGTVQEAMDKVVKTTDMDKLPVFHDEMFYEKHRGCQTSQANTKRNNRKCELLARDTEFLSTVAMLNGGAYDQDAIYDAWKLILLNQFHDILPGSSVNEVYVDADEDYATAKNGLSAAKDTALATLAGSVTCDGPGQPVIVYNTLGWNRCDVGVLPLAEDAPAEPNMLAPDGTPVLTQVAEDADGKKSLLFEAPDVPSMGHAVFHLVDGKAPGSVSGNKAPKATASRLENDFYRIKLNKKGVITEIFDKVNDRQVLADGEKGNQLQLLNDRPFSNDAWDIDFNVNDVTVPVDDVVSIDVVEEGPVRATVRVVWKTDNSTIRQDISLWRTVPRIDFATNVDWHEKHKLLKAAFPVDVLSRHATYEIQFGAIERATHWSTSVDRARYEVPGHKWIDLSESEYGVSLLNDCKYGFDVHDNIMRISLLRSPTLPDPECDQGVHNFVYSLYPHAAGWQQAETVRRAYELNVPLLAHVAEGTPTKGAIPAVAGMLSVDKTNVVIDTVKKAEDSDEIIVRLYEAHGARGPVTLSFADAPKSVVECDLMEENDEAVELAGNDVKFTIKPWEIRTFKVTL